MLDPLPVVLIVASLLVALVVAGYVALGRPVDDPLLAGLAVLEAGLLAQAVIGFVQLAGTDRDVNGAVFVSYLVGALVVLPVGALWSLAERSRSGTAVLIVAALTVAFLVVRLQQIWG
ncbi:hypothetical protein [Nocardioides sp. LHG3406-4]|uniref:hypothetical protein n=1 Tax=Nocardioides sp. LHG3406-4 TaxID=2804575 RepID=UPI003CF2B8DF